MGEGVFMILMNCICIDVVVYPVEKAEMIFSFSFYLFLLSGGVSLLGVSLLFCPSLFCSAWLDEIVIQWQE